MDQNAGEKWREIQQETRLEIKTAKELLGLFKEIVPNGSTVLKEKFGWVKGVVSEEPPEVCNGFKATSLTPDNVYLNWKKQDGKGRFFNINGDQKVAIQYHNDGRRSMIVSTDSGENPELTITRRYTVIPQN
jgi:hypothetical protein